MTYTHISGLSDEEAMVHLKQQHGDALAALFRRYQRLVFSIVTKVLRVLGEAEDMRQNVFIEIYRSSQVYDPAGGSAKVWILKLAYHFGNHERELSILERVNTMSSESLDRTSLLAVFRQIIQESRAVQLKTGATENLSRVAPGGAAR